jgi:hypothetical protein
VHSVTRNLATPDGWQRIVPTGGSEFAKIVELLYDFRSAHANVMSAQSRRGESRARSRRVMPQIDQWGQTATVATLLPLLRLRAA